MRDVLLLTKEELRVLVQICNALSGTGYIYRGKTIQRNAARIRDKAVTALGEPAAVLSSTEGTPNV